MKSDRVGGPAPKRRKDIRTKTNTLKFGYISLSSYVFFNLV